MQTTIEPNLQDGAASITPLEALNRYFGYNEFRKGQGEIIDSILSRKNAVVVMPTGAGKSLCYQVPALCLSGVTIVVSPLIALMKDQVDTLHRRSVPATYINSSLSASEITQRLNQVADGAYKILYIAPERFNDPDFMDRMATIPVSLFAIDEAHCISEWGHDFRPSYTRMHRVIKALGMPTVVALTATATPEVRDDIIRQLDLTDYELFVTGFDRPNLHFTVELASREEKLYKLLEFVKSIDGSGIIYAGTRNSADEIADILNLHDVGAINYHAGLSPEDRKRYQEGFMSNQYQVIVATNAFGMGIDKPDIRFVCHYDMPGTLEAYYQEAGRAGRDGKDSYCLLLYNPSDRYLREFFIKGDNPSRENIEEIYQILCEYPTEPILMTYSEIKSALSDSVPDMTVGTALKILERAGYIELRGDNQKEASLQFHMPIHELLAHIGNRARVKREVVEAIFSVYGESLYNGVSFSLERFLQQLDAKKDSVMRALKDMTKKELITYDPPFRGKEIFIKNRVEAQDLDLNWRNLEDKLERDLDKLNLMEGYVYCSENKKDYILRYFGDRMA